METLIVAQTVSLVAQSPFKCGGIFNILMEVTKSKPIAGEYMFDFRSLAFGRPLTFSTENLSPI